MCTRRSVRTSPLAYDPEVERSARLGRKAVRQFSTNLDFACLKELFTEMSDDEATGAKSPLRGVNSYYRPGNFEDPSSIINPTAANRSMSNFKIQPNLIAILPVFRGHEEPYAHLREFFSIADTYQDNNTTKDGVRLRLFPFLLKIKLRPGSHLSNQVVFTHGEQFHESFSRLKELLRTCPHHDVPKWELVKAFYDGLDYHNQQFVMATSGGENLKIESLSKSVANLERQMGQLAKEVHTREAGKLPSYPDLNPKHKPCGPEHDFITDDEIVVESKNADNVKFDSDLVNDFLKDVPKPPTQNFEATESPKDGEGGVSSTTTPYPAALEKPAFTRLAKKDPHSEDMWETFKQRKLKATLPKKIDLTEHVSAVLSSSLPPKFKDPGALKKALLDLGASINILPASLVDK
nr:hypothetical protein [Tanacetum cinerariifolium]